MSVDGETTLHDLTGLHSNVGWAVEREVVGGGGELETMLYELCHYQTWSG